MVVPEGTGDLRVVHGDYRDAGHGTELRASPRRVAVCQRVFAIIERQGLAANFHVRPFAPAGRPEANRRGFQWR